MALTIEQLGQQVKSKYPQYSNLSDLEIGQRTLKKYPQYQSQIVSDRIEEKTEFLQQRPVEIPTQNFGSRFLENLKRAPKQLFYEQPKEIFGPGIGLVGEVAKPPLRSIAQIGVAAGRSFRGESPQQPAYLPGPIGQYLGDVGIGTPLQEVGKAIETGLTISPETMLKPLAPFGRILQKGVSKASGYLYEKAAQLSEKALEKSKGRVGQAISEMLPIKTKSGLKKFAQGEATRAGNEAKAILAGREGQISVFSNEILADTEKTIRQKMKGASEDVIRKMLNRIKKETILGERKVLTVEELNTVREYIDNSLLKESEHFVPFKGLTQKGKTFNAVANSLRNKVQTLAPATKEPFRRWSAFIEASKGLSKKSNLMDILKRIGLQASLGGGGAYLGGTKGAGGTLAASQLAQSTLARTLGGALTGALGRPSVGTALTQSARFLPVLLEKLRKKE